MCALTTCFGIKAAMLFGTPVDYLEITIQGGAPDGIGAGMTVGAEPAIIRSLGAVRGGAGARLPLQCAGGIGRLIAIG